MDNVIEVSDSNKAYKAAQRAFKLGRSFKTICEWCGWSGDSSELIMAVQRDGGNVDRFCPLCDAYNEWKLWRQE